MNVIQKELIASRKYQLTTFRQNGFDLVQINQDNVAKIEAMIKNDSDYIKSGEIKAAPNDKYKGSTAYWMTKLFQALTSNYEESVIMSIIKETVMAVDRDNSTHISSDNIGIEVLSQRIFDRRKDLILTLQDRNKGFDFIKDLSIRTSNKKVIMKKGKKYYPRENYSFATKFCHYACIYFFNNNANDKYQDNYSIYDSIVVSALPLYLTDEERKTFKEKEISKPCNYEIYSNMIDKIRDGKVSRNGFDHLLWYYFKGRLKSLK